MKKEQFKIELSNEAEEDFDGSYEFYAYKSERVANNFYKEVNISLEKIAKSPYSFPKVLNDVRKFVIKKFPFIIYYQAKQLTIKVIAVFNTSRNPEIWKQRAEKD